MVVTYEQIVHLAHPTHSSCSSLQQFDLHFMAERRQETFPLKMMSVCVDKLGNSGRESTKSLPLTCRTWKTSWTLNPEPPNSTAEAPTTCRAVLPLLHWNVRVYCRLTHK